MTQKLVPRLTPRNTGWILVPTGPSDRAHQRVDEGSTTPNDADYLEGDTATEDVEMTVTSALPAAPSTPSWTITIRHKFHDTGFVPLSGPTPPPTFDLEIKNGSTLVFQQRDIVPLDEVWRTDLYTLTPAQASTISDFTNISVVLRANGPVTKPVRVSMIEIEIPDANATEPMRVTSLNAEVLSRPLQAFEEVSPEDLPANLAPFTDPDWSEGVSVDRSFISSKGNAYVSGAGEYMNLLSRPHMVVTANYALTSRNQMTAAMIAAMRLSDGTHPYPLIPDVTGATASASSGTSVIPVNTLYRRFYEGGRVLVYGMDRFHEIERAQIAQMVDVTDTAITISGTLTEDIEEGDYVVPLLDCDAVTKSAGTFVSGEAGVLTIQAQQVKGIAALPSSVDAVPLSTVSQYEGLPIFSVAANDDVGYAVARESRRVLSGKSSHTQVNESRARQLFSLVVRCLDRQEYWEATQFFDSRRGETHPFWFICEHGTYDLVSLAINYVIVTAPAGDIQNHADLIDAVGWIDSEGSRIVRRIQSILVDTDTTWKIFFTEILSFTPDSDYVNGIEMFSSAHRVRLSPGRVRERWHTDSVCDLLVAFEETLDEGAYSVEGVLKPLAYNIPLVLDGLVGWWDASKNTWVADGSGTGEEEPFTRIRLANVIQRDRVDLIDDARVDAASIVLKGLVPASSHLYNLDESGDLNAIGFEKKWHQFGAKAGIERPTYAISTKGVDIHPSTGMTLFLVARLAKDGAGSKMDNRLVFDGDESTPSTNATFLWQTQRIRLWTPGETASSPVFDFTYPSMTSVNMQIYVLRWDPGASLSIWRNGTQKYTKTTSVPATLRTPVLVPKLSFIDSGTSVVGEFPQGDNTAFLSLVWYNRALTNPEMNIVGRYFADTVYLPLKWKDI